MFLLLATFILVYNGYSSQLKGLYYNLFINISQNASLIDIDVMCVPLDYNILLGHNYMCEMDSSTFHVMTCPDNGKVFMVG